MTASNTLVKKLAARLIDYCDMLKVQFQNSGDIRKLNFHTNPKLDKNSNLGILQSDFMILEHYVKSILRSRNVLSA